VAGRVQGISEVKGVATFPRPPCTLQKDVLACDASSYGVGVVLAHQMPDGSERPVGYASRT
jgi:hypothetical protein